MGVKKGDPLLIRADDWNVLLRVADDARRGALSAVAAEQRQSWPSGVIVPVKNATGSTVSRFHAMGIGDPLFTYADNAQTFKNQLGFEGKAMSSSYLGKFCVAQETIANGKIGLCMVQGVTPAEITVGDADDTHVDVDTAGGSKLVSDAGGGGLILHKPTGTGTKWAVIAIGGSHTGQLKKQHCRFTLGGALATTDASQSATIQTQYGPGVDHPSTSITVRNLLTHTAGTYLFEGDSGDAGIAIYDSGTTWNIVQMECP